MADSNVYWPSIGNLVFVLAYYWALYFMTSFFMQYITGQAAGQQYGRDTHLVTHAPLYM